MQGALVAALAAVVLTAGCTDKLSHQEMAEQPRYEALEESRFFPDRRSARPLVPGTVARGYLRDDRHLYQGLEAEGAQAPAPHGHAHGAGAPAERGHRHRAGSPAEPAHRHGAGSPAAPGRGHETQSQAAHEHRHGSDDATPTPGTAPEAASSPGQPARRLPFAATPNVLARGQERYNVFCVPCHGPAGYGDGLVVQRGFTPPPSLHSPHMREHPVGHFFRVITEGYGAMPAYAGQIPPVDRWAITAYIRALQLSQHATLDAVPAEVRPRLAGTEARP